jgi:nucleotide-binding universal stress UspA family protein
MLRTIAVPLDGSLLAKRALPYAEHLAKDSSTRLMLCRAVTNEIIQEVADQVLRQAPIPVVLVPAMAATPWPPNRPPTLIVTLDGSTLAEAALAPAVDLAQRVRSEMILLQAIPIRHSRPTVTGRICRLRPNRQARARGAVPGRRG